MSPFFCLARLRSATISDAIDDYLEFLVSAVLNWLHRIDLAGKHAQSGDRMCAGLRQRWQHVGKMRVRAFSSHDNPIHYFCLWDFELCELN